MKSLRNIFFSGLIWTVSENILLTLIGLVQLYVTSHILTPIDFGIYAIAVFFYSLARIAFSMGLGPALIQRKGDISGCLNTAWTAGILIAFVASVLLGSLVPVINAYFYHESQATLPSVVILSACVIAAASNPALVYFQREIRLKKIFILNVIPRALSFGILLLIIWLCKSYWGLIFALVSEYVFRTILSYIIYPYKPKFEFDIKIFKELYSFGGWLQIKNMISWLAGNIDVAAVGNILGPVNLGFYNRAQSISSYPRSFLDAAVNSVAFPLYSKIIDDRERFYGVVNQIQDLVLVLLSAISVVVILYGQQLISLVLGEKWDELVMPFKLLLVAYMLQSLVFSFNPVIRAMGKTKQEFLFYILVTVLMLLFLYPGCRLWGLTGAGIAILLATIVSFPIYLAVIKKFTGLPLRHFLVSFIVSILSTVGTYFLIAMLGSIISIHWIAGCAISVIVLIILYMVFGFVADCPGRQIMTSILKLRNRIC